jgi:hypothetical protein
VLNGVIPTVYSIVWPHLGADTWAAAATVTTAAAAPSATTAIVVVIHDIKDRTKGQKESLGQLLEYVIQFFLDEMFIQNCLSLLLEDLRCFICLENLGMYYTYLSS